MNFLNKKTFLIPFIIFSTLLFGFVFYGDRVLYSMLPQEHKNAGLDQPEYSGQFFIGEVTEIIEEGRIEEFDQNYQIVKVKLLTGDDKGKELEIRNEMLPGFEENRKVKVSEEVIINNNVLYSETPFVITDKFRISAIVIISILFLALVFFTSGAQGLKSLLGLVFSVFILLRFVIPAILAGGNPLLISIFAALVIAGVSIYLAHGFKRRTTLALISTLITIILAGTLAVIFVELTQIFGLGSEESFFLKLGEGQVVNLKGLLLGGIIFGTLGVLDDITTAQTAAISEIKKANSKLEFMELYKRGLSIGREHIASLINTLALAYIGSSFPLFLLFYLNKFEPFWITLNSEFMVEEIVRTLVGSSALILAVPISTLIAAKYLNRKDNAESPTHVHSHSH